MLPMAVQIEVGLCESCRHARVVRSDRGSVFYKCERSLAEADFPAYPRLPVLCCSGFERNPAKLTTRKDDEGAKEPA
ncbi:MAG TPA: hypothetical protein VKV79_03750 [Terriglobia bacterium]|nr:hypothetical protein [Terriglobia bacterium]